MFPQGYKKFHHSKLTAVFFIRTIALLFAILSHAPVFAQVSVSSAAVSTGQGRDGAFFPLIYFLDTLAADKNREAMRPYWVPTEEESKIQTRSLREDQSILLNDDILAFYGHPNSTQMGILGRYSIQELDTRLTKLAEEYKTESGGRRIRKAFYIIYGTVWPQGEIGIIKESQLLEYIQYGLDHDILVFIDHQIGRYDPVSSLRRMLPYLKYPNVHLALDPEWRTAKPMKEIGTVTSAEINEAQRVMENYMIENQISGERLLVIHQFNWRMISSREQVQSDFEKVRLVHCADGFGNPSIKKQSYAYNAQAFNMPIKGFKLFYNFNIPGAGYDHPLLSPKEVYALTPRPYLVMYQ
ncbi:MAG: hypothetical protein LBT16_04825 [Treponema sp.]|jgi:hypothetical protein|nr:hypothetical protein [Treponema sp.]